MKQQPGQVLLIVVLLITISLTVGLAAASRAIMNIRLSSEEDQSERAFSAAEAGIEQSLLTNNAAPDTTFSNGAIYRTEIKDVRQQQFVLNKGKAVLKDQGIDIWMSDYSSLVNRMYTNQWNGQLSIYWGSGSDTCTNSESTNTMAALEIIIISGDKNNPKVTQYAFDPCPERRLVNNFSTPNAGGVIGGVTFSNVAHMTIADNGFVARAIPLYADTYMGVQGNPPLPNQGTIIESTGIAGDVQRKIYVLREYPSLPAEFFSFSFVWKK